MEDNLLKTDLLAIAVTGLLLRVTGTARFIFRIQIAGNNRYVMPILPLSVTVCVFVFNLFRLYNAKLPLRTGDMVNEIVYTPALAAVIVSLLSVMLVIVIEKPSSASMRATPTSSRWISAAGLVSSRLSNQTARTASSQEEGP